MNLTASTPAADSDVPERLVATAIEQFGVHGTHAVSLREIQRKAGVLNEAAVRYYFKNRLGLLDACLASVAKEFSPIIKKAWADLDDLRENNRLEPRHVVTAVVVSFYALWLKNNAGVQLVARMIREEAEAGQDMLLRHFGDVIWWIEAELGRLLPEKSAAALRLHSFLAINNIVNGMVDQSLLWRLPAVDDDENLFTLAHNELAQGFIEYVTAGVCSASDLES